MQGPSALSDSVQTLVQYLYAEATHKLNSALKKYRTVVVWSS
jgi:hypothetical protein